MNTLNKLEARKLVSKAFLVIQYHLYKISAPKCDPI